MLKVWSNSTDSVDKNANQVDNNALKLISALLSCNPSMQKSLEGLVQMHMRSKKHKKDRKVVTIIQVKNRLKLLFPV